MIKAKIIYNNCCIKCGVTNGTMVKFGAITMCHSCYSKEFNVEKIDTKSELGKNYHKWLNIQMEKIDNECY